MKTSDITDTQVVEACLSYHDDLALKRGNDGKGTSLDRLVAMTGAPPKVARNAMERSYGRDLVEVGMGIDWAWPTDEGLALLPPDILENSPYVARLRSFA